MATNPKGKGTKTVGVNMKLDMAEEVERRALSMGISSGAYVRILIKNHIASGKKLKLIEG